MFKSPGTCRRWFAIAILCAVIVGIGAPATRASDLPAISTLRVASFSLPAVTGETVSCSFTGEVDWTVLCFLGTECPLAKLYGARLQEMSERFSDEGVRFIGINSNVQDSMEELKTYATDHQLRFPIVKDYDRAVAVSAGATRTPEVVVVDRVGTVRYRGRIDDQYEPGIARGEATKHDLRDAIESLLAGESPAQAVTNAIGCLISLPRARAASSTSSNEKIVTYCADIARVLNQHCVECHRSGEIGPFSLTDYDEVVGWADMSVEVIDNARMPPWHASAEHLPLANAREMPEADKQLIRDWVEAGTPFGNASDLPEPPLFVDGWHLPRQPDLVLKMREAPFTIPAEGIVEYQYYVVETNFETDRWIRAAEVIPGNHAVVHHAIAFIRPPDGSNVRKFGLLSAYVPGQRRSELPEGYAQRVPAGSRIVFQMHYTPTGKPQTDTTRIGMVFADPADVTHEVLTIGGIDQDFEIPPHTADFDVQSDVPWFPRDGKLLSIIPHMHVRGKSFRFQAIRGDERETLLEVPAYDFNWQHSYELATPLPLAGLDRLCFTATFDNSADNPTNPDPNEYVTWGDQTWQEMALVFISVARPLDSGETMASEQQTPVAVSMETGKQRQTQRMAEAVRFADEYFQRLDANGDDVIVEDELPHSVRIFAFRHFDHDQDGQVTRDEIQSEYLSR
jgi:peroxiredoxin